MNSNPIAISADGITIGASDGAINPSSPPPIAPTTPQKEPLRVLWIALVILVSEGCSSVVAIPQIIPVPPPIRSPAAVRRFPKIYATE